MKFFRKNRETEDKYSDYGAFGFDEYREEDEGFWAGINLELIPKKAPVNIKVDKDNRSRLLLGFLILLLLMVALIFRMGYWQIIKADDLKDMATQIQKVDTQIDAVRGSIYDSRMNTLAETVTEYELYGYTYDLYKSDKLTGIEKDETVKKLADITDESRKTIRKRLDSNENLVLLAEGLTKEEVDKAVKIWGSGVYVKTNVTRYYPNGAFAAQLLGGVNSENTGRTGLEYEYNSVLAGIKGRTVQTTDNQGNALATGRAKYYQAQDGYSIVTTVDSVIQHYAEDAIEHAMKRTGATSISCIVMNPKNNEVLALAQTPEYDPNNSLRPSGDSEYKAFEKMSDAKQSEYLSKMWTIDQISSVYEPGSTFKLIAAAAALETGKASMNSSYYCGGKIHVGGIDLHCLGHHGQQSLKVAVSHSCNAALARVALDMGASNFYNYIDLFGFNDYTNIDLPGETGSIIKDPDGMGNVDLATTGYGQGIAVTPIQVLCAVNSFATDGVLMKPHIVSKVIDTNGKTVEEFKSEEIRQVVSKDTAEKMRDIMEYYVTQEGGNKAYVPGFRVGGKTGTANIATGGGYSASTDCSYIAMAPMDDPVISMLIIVHKPTKTQYGNMSAGPIVKSIMEKSLLYLGVEREYTDKEEAVARKHKVSVPQLTGKDSKKAIALLNKAKLDYTVVPEVKDGKSFVVQDQYPKAGTKVNKKTIVYLYRD